MLANCSNFRLQIKSINQILTLILKVIYANVENLNYLCADSVVCLLQFLSDLISTDMRVML